MKKLRFIMMLFMFVLVLVGCDTNTVEKDVVPPSFSGTKDITYFIGSSDIDYLNGITAIDSIDGDLTSFITVNDTEVDLTTPGVYTLTYRVSDLSGNRISTSVSIIVIFIDQEIDMTPPIITGATSITYYIGDEAPNYLDGLVAFDPEDGSLTNSITVDDSEVDLTTAGTYTLTYSVSDLSSNQFSISVSVTVLPVVVVDETPPVITGATSCDYYIGDATPDYLDGLVATDTEDGDLTSSIIVDDANVDLTTAGIYTLTYRVSDLSNNEFSITVSITVLPAEIVDETPPVITGAISFDYYIGDNEPNYLDGLVATDTEDGDLTSSITVDDADVDLTNVGIYDLIYSVSDQAGNSYSITIQITVLDPLQNESPDYLNIFYINDFHGAILEDDDEMGLSNMANLILNEKTINPANTIFIGGGDILQGSLLSNYFNGSSTMDILNNMQMDAFAIGNHEFDWGFDYITNFRNPNSDSLQVDFPLLGANIFLDGTTTRPTNIDAYTIIEKGDLKVGVIGVIGTGLEYSIATSKITGYYFADPVYWTSYYAEYLRDVENVDVVLAVIHDNGVSSGYNQAMSTLTGNQKIDAVFNGHSHSTYAQYIARTGVRMPYLQSGANGTNLGKVTLEFDAARQVTNAYVVNLTGSSDARLRQSNSSIDAVINSYVTQIQPLLEDEIITSGAYMSTVALTYYMAELIRLASDSDIGFHNLGGTRAPLTNGQIITIATLYEIFPFDNKIKTVYLSGASINAFKNGEYYSTRNDNMIFVDNVYYKVATNDYIFDKVENPFITGTDVVDTGILIRDILETAMRNQKAAGYDTFLISNPVVLGQTSSLEIALYLSKNNFDDLYITI